MDEGLRKALLANLQAAAEAIKSAGGSVLYSANFAGQGGALPECLQVKSASKGGPMMIEGWKITTHDLRAPIADGSPIFDGQCPFMLPIVELDEGADDCAPGWHFCDKLSIAFAIAGLWRHGWPARAWKVSADTCVRRKGKNRTAQLTIVREATPEETAAAIHELAAPFAEHADFMAAEMLLWYVALARPGCDKEKVIESLQAALVARKLHDWTIVEFLTTSDMLEAWVNSARHSGQPAWYMASAWLTDGCSYTFPADLWTRFGLIEGMGITPHGAWETNGNTNSSAALRGSHEAKVSMLATFSSLFQAAPVEPAVFAVGLRDALSAGLLGCFPLSDKRLGFVMSGLPITTSHG